MRDPGINGNPNSLYVTLFSNSSMKVYPKIAAFTVQMVHEKNLGTVRWQENFAISRVHRLTLAL